MADNINALLGMGLSPQDDMTALANSLRGEQGMGDYYSMSTLAPISQLGKTMQGRSTDAANRGGVLKQSMLKQAADEERRQAALTLAAANRDQDYKRGLERDTKLQENRVSLAKTKAAMKPKKVDEFETGTGSERQKFEKMAEDAMVQQSIFKGFDPEYANSFTDPISGDQIEGFPFVGELENTLSRVAPILTSEKQQAKAKWWSDYRKYYENIERHGLFGSALTAGETGIWKASNINENMTKEQVQAGLDKMNEVIEMKKKHAQDVNLSKNWSPNYVNTTLGIDAELQGQEQAAEVIDGAIDLSTAPEGLDQLEWDLFSDEEKQEFIDLVIGG
jgi:hypothetical protein